jgi:hypothetical protein
MRRLDGVVHMGAARSGIQPVALGARVSSFSKQRNSPLRMTGLDEDPKMLLALRWAQTVKKCVLLSICGDPPDAIAKMNALLSALVPGHPAERKKPNASDGERNEK